MTMTTISLSKLIHSEANVRQSAPDAHPQLMASLLTQGVLQNLVVVPATRGKFEVIAGGRRLSALQALASDKQIPKTYAVPCVVKDKDDDVTAISLSENVQREAMHPADEFEAFAKLREEGKSIEDIAATFGVTPIVVQRRMALGNVAPVILDQYRNDALNLESVMAFTVCDDHERQLACLRELEHRLWPQAIKHWLLGESVVSNRGVGAFVGQAAYEKAGGAISGDLFAEVSYFSDVDLVMELAVKKLKRALAKLQKDEPDWMWIEVSTAEGSHELGHIQLAQQHVGVPASLATELAELDAKIEAWSDYFYDDNGLPEGINTEDEFDAAYEALEQQGHDLQAQVDKYLTFTHEQMRYSGCVVSFDHHGKTVIQRGLARKADMPKREKGTTQNESPAVATHDENSGLSQSLKDDLGNYRKQATKATLLANTALASDVLIYTLALQTLSIEHRWTGRHLSTVSIQSERCTTKLDNTEEGRAFEELSAAREALRTDWLDTEDCGARFNNFCALSKREKERIMVYCVADSLCVGIRGSSEDQDILIEQLGVDFSAYWRPNKANYFSRLNKAQLAEQFGELMGEEWLASVDSAKKGVVVETLNERFCTPAKDDAVATWLPQQF